MIEQNDIFEAAEARGMVLSMVDDALTLTKGDLALSCDLSHMIPRVKAGKLPHEMLVKAAKIKGTGRAEATDSTLDNGGAGANSRAGTAGTLTAIDATAGFGEDSLLLAATGFNVKLYEKDPIIAALLSDGLRRAAQVPELAEIVGRMELMEGDSVAAMKALAGSGPNAAPETAGFAESSPAPTAEPPDLIYLDPMFPQRQKSGLIKKKFQLLQQLERPCDDEAELLAAAIDAGPRKIVIKRPLKGPCLAGIKPGYTLYGKAIRYDCIAIPR